MNQILVRIVACVVIPCLIPGPSAAAGSSLFAGPFTVSTTSKTRFSFAEQAMTPFLEWTGARALYATLTAHARKEGLASEPVRSFGPRRDYAMSGLSQPTRTTTWAQQEEEIDSLIREAFRQSEEIADSSQQTLNIMPFREQDEEVLLAITFLASLNIPGLTKTFRKLVGHTLPPVAAQDWRGRKQSIAPGLYLISVSPDYLKSHPNVVLRAGHASDLGIYIFTVGENKPSAQVLAARIVHETFAFLGQPNAISTAFEVLASHKTLTPQINLNIYRQSDDHAIYMRRLQEEGEEAAVSKTLRLHLAFTQGITHVKEVLAHPSGRNPYLLKDLTDAEISAKLHAAMAQKIVEALAGKTALISGLAAARAFQAGGPYSLLTPLVVLVNMALSRAFNQAAEQYAVSFQPRIVTKILERVPDLINETLAPRTYRIGRQSLTSKTLVVPMVAWARDHAAWLTVDGLERDKKVAFAFWVDDQGQAMYGSYVLGNQLRPSLGPLPFPLNGVLQLNVDPTYGISSPPLPPLRGADILRMSVSNHQKEDQLLLEVSLFPSAHEVIVETVQPIQPNSYLIEENLSTLVGAIAPRMTSSQGWEATRVLNLYADEEGRFQAVSPSKMDPREFMEVTLKMDADQLVTLQSVEFRRYIHSGKGPELERRRAMTGQLHGNALAAIHRYNEAISAALSNGRDFASEQRDTFEDSPTSKKSAMRLSWEELENRKNVRPVQYLVDGHSYIIDYIGPPLLKQQTFGPPVRLRQIRAHKTNSVARQLGVRNAVALDIHVQPDAAVPFTDAAEIEAPSQPIENTVEKAEAKQKMIKFILQAASNRKDQLRREELREKFKHPGRGESLIEPLLELLRDPNRNQHEKGLYAVSLLALDPQPSEDAAIQAQFAQVVEGALSAFHRAQGNTLQGASLWALSHVILSKWTLPPALYQRTAELILKVSDHTVLARAQTAFRRAQGVLRHRAQQKEDEGLSHHISADLTRVQIATRIYREESDHWNVAPEALEGVLATLQQMLQAPKLILKKVQKQPLTSGDLLRARTRAIRFFGTLMTHDAIPPEMIRRAAWQDLIKLICLRTKAGSSATVPEAAVVALSALLRSNRLPVVQWPVDLRQNVRTSLLQAAESQLSIPVRLSAINALKNVLPDERVSERLAQLAEDDISFPIRETAKAILKNGPADDAGMDGPRRHRSSGTQAIEPLVLASLTVATSLSPAIIQYVLKSKGQAHYRLFLDRIYELMTLSKNGHPAEFAAGLKKWALQNPLHPLTPLLAQLLSNRDLPGQAELSPQLEADLFAAIIPVLESRYAPFANDFVTQLLRSEVPLVHPTDERYIQALVPVAAQLIESVHREKSFTPSQRLPIALPQAINILLHYAAAQEDIRRAPPARSIRAIYEANALQEETANQAVELRNTLDYMLHASNKRSNDYIYYAHAILKGNFSEIAIAIIEELHKALELALMQHGNRALTDTELNTTMDRARRAIVQDIARMYRAQFSIVPRVDDTASAIVGVLGGHAVWHPSAMVWGPSLLILGFLTRHGNGSVRHGIQKLYRQALNFKHPLSPGLYRKLTASA